MKRWVWMACVAVSLTGCKSWLHRKDECLSHQPYEDAVSVPSLHGTGDLPPPANKQSLKIPELANNYSVKVKCLDQPPKFSEGASDVKPTPKLNEGFHTPIVTKKSKKSSQPSTDHLNDQ